MKASRIIGCIAAIIMFAVILGGSIVAFDKIEREDTSHYEFKVIIHEDGLTANQVYYTNQPPMLGGNSVLFIDARTGLTVLEIAPRITVKQQNLPKPEPQ